MGLVSALVGPLLVRHGLLPGAVDVPALLDDPPSADLLPLLQDAWERAAVGPCRGGRLPAARRVAARLAYHAACGARVTWGIPGTHPSVAEQWIGLRLVWWPRGIPPGTRVGVVSSRLGRRLDLRPNWFAALRQLCLTLDPERELLLTATGTTAARFLQRAAHLFDLPLLVLEPSGTRETLDSWFMRRLAMEEVAGSGMNVAWSAWVSPCLGEDPGGAAPLGDRLVLATSARVLVSHVRPSGQIRQLVQQRLLARREGAAVAVILAVGEGLVPEPVARAWIPWGAAAVRVDAPDPHPQGAIVPVTAAADQATHAPIWSLSELADRVTGDEYLTHCTRAARGPWPDESLDDYLDQLILGGRESDRSALATLSRIARRQRILASAESIRGTRPVVCFTAVPLAELPRLRTFRPHRGRWDFEPYGISLHRQWLQQQGARPVRYGDASLWERLPNAERPFFQCRYAGKDRTIDWSIEREWRHVGDLDLSRLPDDAAWLVVPTREEARLLSPWSRWPIVVMDAELGTGDR